MSLYTQNLLTHLSKLRRDELMNHRLKLKNEYFFCYSKGLKNWISNNQVSHITKAKAISTDKEFWLYEQSEELEGLVSEYEQNKEAIRNRGYRPA